MKPVLPSVFLSSDAVQTQTAKLMGRQSAGRGFMRGLAAAYRGDDRSLVLVHGGGSQQARLEMEARDTGWVQGIEHRRVQEPSTWPKGVMYYPAPFNTRMGWQRHREGPAGMAFCGVTHTISSSGVLAQIADYVQGPFTAADALVCTSQSVRKAVHQVFQAQIDWISHRHGVALKPHLPMTPVIPLGIPTQDFTPDAAMRAQGRARWSLEPDEVAVLFVGRLSLHAKANPVPMYMAVARAAAMTGRRLRVLECGWFSNDAIRQSFDEAAQLAGVQVTRMDGREAGVTRLAYASADVFMSLSDNIQETFGLTPLEAMASGLPVIASDWDGYRETVRDGVDGFLIPTLQIGVPAAAQVSSEAYEDGRLNYDHYIAHAHLQVAVDVPTCAQALARLVEDDALRQRMGAAGRERALQVYDWSVVMRQYQSLWAEQTERLAYLAADPQAAAPQRDPAFMNPLQLFDHYPSALLQGQHRLWRAADTDENALGRMRDLAMWQFAGNRLSSGEALTQAWRALPEGMTEAPQLQAWARSQGWILPLALRNAAWLAKVGLVQTDAQPGPSLGAAI
jgi:glycosyltransferase involved in cell wall biosynthesis